MRSEHPPFRRPTASESRCRAMACVDRGGGRSTGSSFRGGTTSLGTPRRTRSRAPGQAVRPAGCGIAAVQLLATPHALGVPGRPASPLCCRDQPERSHAAVTAGFYHPRMLGTERHNQPEATGVLIIRVWQEGSRSNPQLRVRIVGQQSLARKGQDTVTAATIEDTLAYICDWLQRFAQMVGREHPGLARPAGPPAHGAKLT